LGLRRARQWSTGSGTSDPSVDCPARPQGVSFEFSLAVELPFMALPCPFPVRSLAFGREWAWAWASASSAARGRERAARAWLRGHPMQAGRRLGPACLVLSYIARGSHAESGDFFGSGHALGTCSWIKCLPRHWARSSWLGSRGVVLRDDDAAGHHGMLRSIADGPDAGLLRICTPMGSKERYPSELHHLLSAYLTRQTSVAPVVTNVRSVANSRLMINGIRI
jgi:hypothetical protein